VHGLIGARVQIQDREPPVAQNGLISLPDPFRIRTARTHPEHHASDGAQVPVGRFFWGANDSGDTAHEIFLSESKKPRAFTADAFHDTSAAKLPIREVCL
jgi:hypothetical protein